MRELLRGLPVAVALVLSACGGGGGGGGGGAGSSTGGSGNAAATPLVYAGNANATVVTATNSGKVAAIVVGSEDTAAPDAVTAISVGAPPPSSFGSFSNATRPLHRALRETRLGDIQRRLLAGVNIDTTRSCESGSVRVTGALDSFFTGTLTFTYNDCRDGDLVISGRATVRVDSYDSREDTILDGTFSFERVALRSGTSTAEISGKIRIQRDTLTETTTEDYVFLSGTRMVRVEAFVTLDDRAGAGLTGFRRRLHGRVYDSSEGLVLVDTLVPLLFASKQEKFPKSGTLKLVGAGNRSIILTAVSSQAVRLAVDTDGDDIANHIATLRWVDLSAPAGADLADTDGDGLHNSWESSYGLNPANAGDANLDLDGDGATNRREYLAGSLANSAASLPFIADELNLAGVACLLYDSVRDRIYAAVRGNPGRIVAIDPQTNAMEPAIQVGADPIKLAISDNGQYLYVGLDGEGAIERIELATRQVDLKFLLGSRPDPVIPSGPWFVEDMEVLPGNPQSIAVSLRTKLWNPRHEGVAVYDNGVRRTNMTQRHTGSNVIEFSASAAVLYGYNNETSEQGFRRMSITASGVSTFAEDSTFLVPAFFNGSDMRFSGGLIFSTAGQVFDPVTRTMLRTFSESGSIVVPDSADRRVFFLSGGGWLSSEVTLRAFHMDTAALLGSEKITGTNGNAFNLIRWGTKGLAFHTDEGQIFLVHSPALIP